MASVKESKDTYVLKRDGAETSRLNRQHVDFTNNTGYLIHPQILKRLPNKGAHIADLGTGTGVWALDVANHLPKDTTIDGFDISGDQFPDVSSLPPNVTLKVADIKLPFPPELHGTYDLVHLRLLLVVMEAEDWETVSKNILKLLKPGGAIMWGEAYLKSGIVVRAGAPTTGLHLTTIYKLSTAFLAFVGLRASALNDDTFLKIWTEVGLKDVQIDMVASDRVPDQRHRFSLHTMSVFLNWARASAKAQEGTGKFWSLAEIDEFERKIAEEHDQGWYYRWDILTAVGWKPDAS